MARKRRKRKVLPVPTYDQNYRRLLKHFLAKIKRGIVLNLRDLQRYCKKNKMDIADEVLREMRYHFKWTAVHSKAVKPKGYMSQSIPKYGSYFVDFAEFRTNHLKQNLVRANRGYVGFFVFVEGVTNKTFAFPVKSKDQATWEKTIYKLLEEHTGEVRNLVSDRDSAVSKRFRDDIKRRLNITWFFLYNRSKSFRAENQIGYLKNRMNIAMKTKDTKVWYDLLPGLVKDYNDRTVPKTDMKRKSVNKSNYMQFLSQKWDTPYPGMLINTLSESRFTKRMAAQLFKYRMKQRVLLRANSRYSSLIPRFAKATTEGRYIEEVFTVVGRKLKTNSTLFSTPVYRIEGEKSGELQAWFYDTDLIPARFADKQ